MGESFWTTQHIEIIGLILLPMAAIWLDLRREAGRNRDKISSNQLEIEKRFTTLEVMVKPLSDWWNSRDRRD